MSYRYGPDDQVRDVWFDKSAPKGKFRKAIASGAATWGKLDGVARFVVHKSPSVGLNDDPCARHEGSPIGGVLRGPIAGSGTLALNRSCLSGETGHLVGFRQIYNTKYKFYTGSGEPPNNKYDLQGVATHELGHSEGWTGDHFENSNDSGLCANKSGQATMCPVIYPGTKRLRTLTKNDKKPVKQAYSQESPLPLGALASSSATKPYRAGVRGCLLSVVLIRTGRENDTFEGDDGRQLVGMGRGADIALGKGGDDCIVGGPGDDDLRPGLGNDTVVGGPGADIVVGGPGSDVILGLNGPDQIYVGDGVFDRVRCGPDIDSVYTADPIDVLIDCELAPSAFTEIPLAPDYE